MIRAEPFTFGDWTETEKCSENCKLMLNRTCELVNVDGLTPLSCEEQTLAKEGHTLCECGGDSLHFSNGIVFLFCLREGGKIMIGDSWQKLITILSSGTTESTGTENGISKLKRLNKNLFSPQIG